jgi:hypothetical protein
MVIGGKTPNNSHPFFHQVGDSGLKDVGFGDECDSCLRPIVSVALSLWVNGYCPFLGLVGWTGGRRVLNIPPNYRRKNWRTLIQNWFPKEWWLGRLSL